MITKEILEAQKGLYQKAREHWMKALGEANANVSATGGAIDACENLLKILRELESAEESSKVKPKK